MGDKDDLNCTLAGEWGRGYCWGRCFAEEEATGLHRVRHQEQGALQVDSQGPRVSGRLFWFLSVVFIMLGCLNFSVSDRKEGVTW